ncbi:hypothetical protein CGCTS75_v012176 [Colletotrichum tropicale]|nr:hypothetical protein CGCTS75_v012176 [Colletotrichum tropicale]
MTHTRRRGRELNLVALPKQMLLGCLHYPTDSSVMPPADMLGDMDNEPTPRLARGRGKARIGSPDIYPCIPVVDDRLDTAQGTRLRKQHSHRVWCSVR